MKAVAAILFLALAASPSARGAAIDYLRQVKPVLAEHCYRCHGASQQKGGLRLDTVSAALKGGEHGPALKPGASAQSLLMQAVRGEHDSISRMPYKKPPLPEPVIADLARWIDAGAPAPADEAPDRNIHWAFKTPVRPNVPANSASRNTLHPIDAFVRARLAQDKIRPSPEADRATLLRRVSLDLTGLPPSPDEVDRFVRNRRADAYERIVETLLASPHHGERWARWWLDAARYADSNGYSVDAPRSIWKYRDWVIAALNRDLPFDQFTIEQLAGDLLPAATLDQKIATGFHRNTQINQEGGIDPEQFRIESVMDRVNTTATVWLGVTLACAQCHDHKFDPFTQGEYYQFYAFFNSTIEDGHGKGAPDGMLEIPDETEGTADAAKELAEAEAELERYLNTKGSELARWEQSLNDEARAKLKGDVRRAIDKPFADRTVRQKRAAYGAFKPDDADFKQRAAKLTQLERNHPKPVTTLVMRELPKPRESRVFTKGDFTALFDTKRMAERRASIDLMKTKMPRLPSVSDSGTFSLVVADAAGNVVSLSASLTGMFGSKIVTKHGFVLNDALSEFAMDDYGQRAFTRGPNFPRGRARPVSNLVPTIVTKDGRAVLGVSASGGLRGITGLTQVLLAHLGRAESLSEAVAKPRVHVNAGGALRLEEGLMELLPDLTSRGETVERSPISFSAVTGIAIRPSEAGSAFTPVFDTRKGGAVSVEKAPANVTE